ncbi:rhomboid family intramembrane serine protease [Virgibacillus salarius]|uniref:rhomboid family intramembrane serine protease n=1 Tax=Virgibacillus salarius TaxID=447199 RepID=UPI0004105AC5|nr:MULTISPECIES: rhomboid family intramembrane serine protease [Bacillaceae]WBX80666.1 rhomboid family intramembrane serine protease [Virgibacillus salarius]
MFIRNERSIKEFRQAYPIVTTLVIIHLGLWIIIDLLQLPFGDTLYQFGAGSNYYIHQGEYWRLITPIFLHVNLTHALFNSFSLVLFGPALEQMLGRTKFIIAYLAAGFIGNLGTYLFGSLDFSFVHVGASGAIFGLFGIYIFMVTFRKHLIDQTSSQIILTIVIVGLIMTFIRQNINIYGHIFGFIGGFAIAPIVLTGAKMYNHWATVATRRNHSDDSIQFDPNRWNKKRFPAKWKNHIWWIIFAILVFLGLMSRIL